jgi:hypothetical protein
MAVVPAQFRSLALTALAAAGLVAPPAQAQSQAPLAVDLELVLAVDVSYSINPEELRVQREGYVDALTHPLILAAIAAGRRGRIALTYVEWGGAPQQVMPWTLIDGREAAERFAAGLLDLPYRRISFTSISRALLYSRALLHDNAFAGARRVVDVSGDGPNNDGAPITLARDTLTAEGIEINGLALILPRPRGAPSIPELDAYYRNCVIGGPGAFVLTVRDTAAFAATIRQKLYLEIAYPKLTRRLERIPGFERTPGSARMPWQEREPGSERLPSGASATADIVPAQYPGRSCFIGKEMQERIQ